MHQKKIYARQQRKNVLKDIAARMAINLFNISCPQSDKDKKLVFKSTSKAKSLGKQRIIIVTGAGASYNACEELGLGIDTAEYIQNQYTRKRIKDGKYNIIEKEINHLATASKLPKNGFETVLFAIYKYFPESLIQEIYKRYDHRFYPSLFYELVAHLLNHRCIDAVINFSFDEVLDRAIDDELINEDYLKVITDGNIPAELDNLFDNGTLKTPIYVKPHGTVSAKSTLRFTEEHYYGLPEDIKKLITYLVSGAPLIKQKDAKSENFTINIVVAGFAMQSFEFLEILEKIPIDSKLYLRLYWFDINNKSYRDFIKSRCGKRFKCHFIKIKNIGLDRRFQVLIKEINNNFLKGFQTRGIKRHILIHELFKRKKKYTDIRQRIKYLEKRLKVELLLSIAKYKGFATMRQLTKDRAGIYYNLYKEEFESFNKKRKAPSFIAFVENIDLEYFSYSREAMIFKKDCERENSLTFKKIQFKKVAKILSHRGRKVYKNKKASWRKTFDELIQSSDTEVNPKFKNVFDNQFKTPQILNTKLAMDIQTKQLMNKVISYPEDMILMIIAESGQWLTKYLKKIPPNKLQLLMIVADEIYDKELQKAFKKCNENSIFTHLNWWVHNQHMTIWLCKNAKGKINWNDKNNMALYLSRRMRASNISPVILKKHDIIPLVETFFAYLIKAGISVNMQMDPCKIKKEDLLKITKSFKSGNMKIEHGQKIVT